MAYLGTEELKAILPSCIDKYDKNRIDNVAYELSLGDEAYLTDSANGKKEKLDDKNSQVVIKSGQFALLLTDEIVTIPNNILAFISIKFSQKIKGLLNVSGFHVDPGFKGRVIFSVYNAGPTTIVLDKGKPYFMIWFSKLTSTSIPYNGKHNGQTNISAENVSNLKGELASPNALLKRIKKNEAKLTTFSVMASILMTIGVGLSLNVLYNTPKPEKNLNVDEKIFTIKIVDSVFNDINLNNIISQKVDSILYKSVKND